MYGTQSLKKKILDLLSIDKAVILAWSALAGHVYARYQGCN